MDDGTMIDAFLLLKDGTLKRSQDVEEVFRLVEEAGDGWNLWLDLEAPHEEEFGLLTALFNLHPLALDACFNQTHHSKVDDYDDHLYIIFNTPLWGEEDVRIKTSRLDCFLGPHFLVTHHLEPFPSIQEAKVRCLKREDALSRGADYLLYMILAVLVDNYSPVLERIGDAVEAAEAEVLAKPKPSTLKRLFSLRKEVARLRQLVLRQKEILLRLSGEEHSSIRREQAVYYRDAHGHLARASDLMESHRDTIAGAVEAYTSLTSNRKNAVVRILTVLVILMFSLTLIAGIYGINPRFMPELPSPYGQYAVLGFVAFMAIIMLVFFRWKNRL